MPVNFPISPTLNQVYTYGSRTWTWDGNTWVIVPLAGPTGPTGPAGPSGASGFEQTFLLMGG